MIGLDLQDPETLVLARHSLASRLNCKKRHARPVRYIQLDVGDVDAAAAASEYEESALRCA